MSEFIARKGDACTGVCAIHGPVSGTITGSGTTVMCEGALVSRNDDIVTASCGHTGKLVTSSSIIVENQPIAHVGDSFTGIFTGTVDARAGTTQVE